jgi:hypothetical protein
MGLMGLTGLTGLTGHRQSSTGCVQVKEIEMNRSKTVGLSMLGAVALAATSAPGQTVFSVGGDATNASIQGTVDAFRGALGANNGVGGGPFASGRREINWDAPALDASADPNHMAPDFFNNNSKRGALFSTPGNGFFVSRRNAGDPTDANLRFGSVDASYNSEFTAFSAQRLFVADGSLITDVTFRVPSLPGVAARVNGFGAVFTDVDLANVSRMEFYGAGNLLLHSEFVPAATVGRGGQSFLGVLFNGLDVERVRIIAGNVAIQGGLVDGIVLDGIGTADVVAMDDFIYGEPVPAPAGVMVACTGLVAVGMRRRR